jgi:hypothetical protein
MTGDEGDVVLKDSATWKVLFQIIWKMQHRICKARGKRNSIYWLAGIVELDRFK